MQVLLNADAGRQVAKQWPQYQQSLQLDSSGKPHLHLGVMLYFFFWTAFFVLRGTQPASSQASMLGPTNQARVAFLAGPIELLSAQRCDLLLRCLPLTFQVTFVALNVLQFDCVWLQGSLPVAQCEVYQFNREVFWNGWHHDRYIVSDDAIVRDGS